MLIRFFLHLKANGLKPSIGEFLSLLAALKAQVIDSSVDQFYVLAKATLVKDESHFDRFDLAFKAYFDGVSDLSASLYGEIPQDWLRAAAALKLPVSRRMSIFSASAQTRIVEKCCSASNSVGAITATW